MKKAQITNQVFIYILTVLIIGLLLFFGIKWIGDFVKGTDSFDEIQFIKNIENSFSGIQYGSAINKNFHVPSGVDMVCFVDSDLPKPEIRLRDLCLPGSEVYEPLICNGWLDNTSAILFAPPLEHDINIRPVRIEDPQKFLCFSTVKNNWVKVRLIGLGNRVKVTLPEPE